MKKKLSIRKVTIRDLDEARLTTLAGGQTATQGLSCGCTGFVNCTAGCAGTNGCIMTAPECVGSNGCGTMTCVTCNCC